MKIAIRADGGHEIGYGHIVRTSVLASELKENGHEICYLTKTPEAINQVTGENFQHLKLDKNRFPEILETENFDISVIDSYDIDTQAQRKAREFVDKSIVVSDDNRYEVYCDILLNGNIYAPELKYEWRGKEPKWLLGLKYTLIREEFLNNSKSSIEKVNSVLVLMGGSDMNNVTPYIMEVLDKFDLSATIVIGPGFENKDEIKIKSENSPSSFELKENPENLAEVMKDSDIALTATGSSVYELIATETPFIGVPQTPNQEPIAESIEKRGLGLISSKENLEGELNKLLNKEIFNEIKGNMNGLIDDKNSKRVRREIES